MCGSGRRSLLGATLATAIASAAGRTCVGDRCGDVSQWCPARNCGAFRIAGLSPDDSGWHSSKDAAACKSIHFAFAKKIGVEDAAIYCVSEDTTLGGFQCFKGDGWLSSMLDYLGHDAYSGNEAIELNQTSCNSLELDSEDAGTLYVGGQCCTGGAVPCNHPLCRHGFRPLGPAVTSSVVSVVLVIIALVHCFTSLQCIVFADRLIENARSAKDMGADDKAAFKNIITMLGAAHGGFAGILVFGALQDWFSGKSQVAMAALAWYGVLGPVAEAMQYKREHGSSVQYVNACVSAAQAECGGQVPKVNYHLLCIPLLIAIGTESFGIHFIVAISMVVAGLITSLIIAHVAPDRSGGDDDHGASEMR